MKIGDKVICVKNGNLTGDEMLGKIFVIEIIRKNNGLSILFFKNFRHIGYGCYAYRFRKLSTHPNFKSKISKQLANKPLIKEGIERIEVKELI